MHPLFMRYSVIFFRRCQVSFINQSQICIHKTQFMYVESDSSNSMAVFALKKHAVTKYIANSSKVSMFFISAHIKT